MAISGLPPAPTGKSTRFIASRRTVTANDLGCRAAEGDGPRAYPCPCESLRHDRDLVTSRLPACGTCPEVIIGVNKNVIPLTPGILAADRAPRPPSRRTAQATPCEPIARPSGFAARRKMSPQTGELRILCIAGRARGSPLR